MPEQPWHRRIGLIGTLATRYMYLLDKKQRLLWRSENIAAIRRAVLHYSREVSDKASDKTSDKTSDEMAAGSSP